MFKFCDTDQDGLLSEQDLQSSLVSQGYETTAVELKMLIARVARFGRKKAAFPAFVDEITPSMVDPGY